MYFSVVTLSLKASLLLIANVTIQITKFIFTSDHHEIFKQYQLSAEKPHEFLKVSDLQAVEYFPERKAKDQEKRVIFAERKSLYIDPWE